MKYRWWCGGLLALGLAVILTGAVSAHAGLVSSNPAAGERLSASPTTITLFFDGGLSTEGSRFELFTAENQSLGIEGRVDLTDPDHARLLAANIAPLADGVYTVRWTALSDDGDGAVTEGYFEFGIGPTAMPRTDSVTVIPTRSPEVNAAPTAIVETPTSNSAWLPIVIVGGVALVLVVMAFGLMRGKR